MYRFFLCIYCGVHTEFTFPVAHAGFSIVQILLRALPKNYIRLFNPFLTFGMVCGVVQITAQIWTLLFFFFKKNVISLKF